MMPLLVSEKLLARNTGFKKGAIHENATRNHIPSSQLHCTCDSKFQNSVSKCNIPNEPRRFKSAAHGVLQGKRERERKKRVEGPSRRITPSHKIHSKTIASVSVSAPSDTNLLRK